MKNLFYKFLQNKKTQKDGKNKNRLCGDPRVPQYFSDRNPNPNAAQQTTANERGLSQKVRVLLKRLSKGLFHDSLP